MKTIKPIIAPFMALILALFAAVVPLRAQSTMLVYGGYHDDGVGPDGNHYFETYWYGNDSSDNCNPYGAVQVQFLGSFQISNNQWVPSFDVFQSYAGVSGFAHRECQVNIYARNGTGLRGVQVQWQYNGTEQPGKPLVYFTF